ncbi:G2/mitotic-specific cyclin-B3 isoform X1 [Plutella xylostella]|uniref:G2/mitotic-specific cyclin-B3 isoform X1 n=1 Tax=Plutella xylostella TaxID=51655 RepID=UPI0020322721|nr:G2/mitotic-specific cyclin-B3 isoform X1 [Plutella xylostella]
MKFVMAPTRLASKPLAVNENLNILGHGITTRSKQMATLKTYKDSLKAPNKRKADSPMKDATAKRAAFGDITNAFNKSSALGLEKEKAIVVKKVTVESKVLPTVKNIRLPQATLNGKTSKTKTLQRVATNAIESVQKHFAKDPPKPVAARAQNGILKNIEKKEKTVVSNKENQNVSQGSGKSARSDMSGEPSLYMTALENISPTDVTKEEYKTISEKLDKVVLDDTINKSLDDETESPHEAPAGVPDFDQENWNDQFQVSNYAMDIFNYLKGREHIFQIDDYLQRSKGITSWMRSLLVDWMVEVQESFELNHETLYLAVKLVDLYLTRATRKQKDKDPLTKEELQLLGASSLFIAAKFDDRAWQSNTQMRGGMSTNRLWFLTKRRYELSRAECRCLQERIPPLVDDFLYICDGAYTLSQLLKMEMEVLYAIDFDLGVPLSYRFLRRYARCARVSMPTLTLARFILELCLLEYGLVSLSDSKMAAAALYIALRMKALGNWTPTLEYYTGYKLAEILPVALLQNAVLHKKPKSAISTVRNKYSHTIFFEVAKVPLVDDAFLSS